MSYKNFHFNESNEEHNRMDTSKCDEEPVLMNSLEFDSDKHDFEDDLSPKLPKLSENSASDHQKSEVSAFT